MTDQNQKSSQPDENHEQHMDEIQMPGEPKPKDERPTPTNDFLNALYVCHQS